MRSAALVVILGTARIASAQPATFDEPHDVIDIQPAPAKRTVVVQQCVPCRKKSSFKISLEATAGYAGWVGPLFLDRVHGPVVNAAAVFTWGRGTAIGVRFGGTLGGLLGRMKGEREGFFSDSVTDLSPRMYAGHIAVQANLSCGIWVAKGFGVTHWSDVDGDHYTFPELVLLGGYNLHLSDNIALQLGIEMGTSFISFRGAVNGGMLFRF